MKSRKESDFEFVERMFASFDDLGSSGIRSTIEECEREWNSGRKIAAGVLGYIFDTGVGGVVRDPEKAEEYYRENLDDPDTCYNLANFLIERHEAGKAVLLDEYFSLLLFAAENGVIKAQDDLGKAYEEGVGCSESEFGALAWYSVAAENGDRLGISNRKRCLEESIGVIEA